MKHARILMILGFATLTTLNANAQMATNWLPGRVLVKLLPDYLRPRVYALNSGDGTNSGTLLALSGTNGATIGEISVGVNPTDMAITPAGDALYVINTGSRTISKVNLDSFSVVDTKSISTPNSYSPSNPLHLALGRSNVVYFTDGAWGPNIYAFDYPAGTNLFVYNDGYGAGGMTVTRDGNTMYKWMQYGWSAGYANSWITRLDTRSNNTLTPYENGPGQSRDPLDTPILLDASETHVFNKLQMVAATNVSVLLSQFSENIYAISFDGSLAFGPTKVFNSQNGITLTNFSISTTVQTLSGDQKRLFRYRASTSELFVYDMATIAPTSGPDIVPTPADGSVVGLPPTNLLWSVSPIALAYDVYWGTNQAQVAAANSSSAQYLGRVTSQVMALPQTPAAGRTYFWRVDVVGFSVTNVGPTWSFTVSEMAVMPTEINLGAIVGFNPASQNLTLTSSVPISWTAAVAGANWLTITPTNGTSPSTVTLNFNSASLPAGTYTNQIDVNVGELTVEVPVTLDIKPLNIIKMVTDYQRPYIYALQAPANSGQNGQVLFINTITGNIEKTLPIGFNPVDLTVHYGEDRLYIASWTENATYVVDLATQTLLPPLHLGTDVYKINAGKPGRIITEGEDQWIAVNIVDTATGTVVGSMPYPEREGDGESDPSGNFYYHCDNNISDAHIHKEQIVNDVATEVASSLQHPYGSRNLVLSPDGTTLFWQGYVYDADLNELGSFGEQIYATTAHGDLALGSQHVFNSHNGQTLYTWPFSTTVMAVSGDQQKVFLYNGTSHQLVAIPMSSIASVPGPGLNPTPAGGAVINPPLAQVSWTVSPFALDYRVYMGTNEAAVAGADTNSALYLGTTSSNAFALSTQVNPGSTYFWRVDSVGFSGMTTGSVWSFTVSALTVTPQTLSLSGVAGLPVLPQTISLTAPLPASWTLTVAQSWLTASANNGTTPSSVTLNFNTTNLPAGIYTNQLTLAANGVTLQLPVTLQLFDLNASKMVADPNRDYIYVLHPGSGSFADAFLLFLNTDTGVVEKVIPIGTNPTDLTVSRFEDRLYVSNWQHNQTEVVDLKTRTLLPPLALGTDVYKINAGLLGRLVYEQEDQWIYAYLINTTNGATLASAFLREGDGEFDPSGRYYYHVDNNSTGAGITKFDVGNNSFVSVASAGKHNGYGSRNLIMSLDGSRLFWTGAMYDANLYDFGVIGGEIYACSTNGSVAFTDHQAIDTTAKQVIFNLPVTTSVMTVDRQDQRLWYFNSASHRIESLSLMQVRSPSITQQPAANTTIGVGGNVYLSVSAMGLNPLSYQWLKDGTNQIGETNYFLALNNIQPSQQGDYQIVVSNSYGAVTSAVAQVTVLVPPTITSQPIGTNVLAGQPFMLSVEADGSKPFNYQWLFQGNALLSATDSTLTVSNAQSVNGGVYSVIVANPAGSVTSSVAVVRVLPSSPIILSGPDSLVIPASSNAMFNVTTTGSQPMSFQWRFNGTPIAGADAAHYSLSNVQSWNNGDYEVVVANGVGVVTSAVATLTVTPVKPYFVTQPVGASLPAGTNLTLTGMARGSEPITYQWRQDTVDLTNDNQNSLNLSDLKITDSGSYTLLAFNSAGMSTSAVATVVVTAAPPVFVQQPVSVSVLSGTGTTLNSLAAGSAPVRYQWYFNDNPVLNETNRQLALAFVSLHSAGPYFVVATNSYGMATSTVAQVTVNVPATLLQPLTNLIADAGDSVTLTAWATGNDPLNYSWKLNGVAIPDNTMTLMITNIQTSQSGYYQVTVANQYGTVTSTGRVSVFGPPAQIFAWGDDSGGQTDVPTNLDDVVSVAGGDFHTLALRHDGSLVAWGYNGDGQTNVPADTTRFISIAAGANHNLAVTENGSVVAWGRNDYGQCNVPASANAVLAVAAGDSHSAALLSSGAVICWGDNTYGQVSGASGLVGIRAIAAGRIHNLALRNNGTVVGWGFNGYGETTPPPGLSNVIAIAAGYLHSVALCSNGTVVVWGDNSLGQTNIPAGLSNVVAIAAGDFHTFALRTDGSIVGWGDDSFGQTEVPLDMPKAIAMGSGHYHGLALVPVIPKLYYRMDSGHLVLQWNGSGVLQWAPTPTGPFTDMPGSWQNNYTNFDLSLPAKFFRLRR